MTAPKACRTTPSTSRLPDRTALCALPYAVVLAMTMAWPAQANQSLLSAGYGMTVGPVFNRNNLGSAAYNPANAVRLVAPDEKVRLGVVAVGGQYELGKLDDIQASIDKIDAAIRAAANAPTEAAVQAQIDIVNGLLPALDAGGRFSVSASGSVLTPLLVRSEALDGVVSFNANAQLQVAGALRSADAVIVRNSTNVATGLTTASAFDVKAAAVTQVSLGYSTDVSRHLAAALGRPQGSAQLDVGLRLNAYNAKLYRQLVAFVDDNGNVSDADFNQDSVDNRSASALGIDLGALWADEHFQLGGTLYNLGSPKFNFPDPTRDANLANRSAASRLVASGKIGAVDSVALKPHLVFEGSVFSANKRWLGQASIAANETPNFVGEPQRLATVSVSFNAERFEGSGAGLLNDLVPSARLGLRKNLAGDKLASTGLGLSWGVVSVDVNVSQQSIQADGNKVPRTAGVSLAIAEKF